MNAVIYARYSSYRQDERSIEGQIEDCTRFAEQNEYKVVGEYIDRARSGTNAEHRTEFQRMIKDSEKRAFDVILVYKLDRFARNRYDSAMYKAKLKKNGVRIVSVTEAISEEPEGVILESLLEGLAEYYSKNLAQNVSRGMRVARQHGFFTGGAIPYGYRVEEKKLVPDEKEARVVQKVFEMYADRVPMSDIIAEINRLGFKPRKGQKFAINSFYRMLRSPKYIGEYTFDGVEYPDIYPALVDRDLWDRVQTNLKCNLPTRTRVKPEVVNYQLAGKLFCGMCGSTMIGESGHGKGGAVYHYYTCHNRKKNHVCKKKNEKKDFIEWYVVEQTMQYVLTPERIDLIAEKLHAQYEKDCSDKKISELEKLSKQLDVELDKCVTRLIDEDNKAIQARIKEQFEKLSEQKEDVDIDVAQLKLVAKKTFTVDQYKQWLGTFANGDPLDENFRQKVIDTFVNSVYLFDDKIVIYYNIKGGKQISYMEMCDDMENLEPMDDIAPGSRCSDSTLNGSPFGTLVEHLFIISERLFALVITERD